jgi:uncharacterized protein YndB with AHSA1/START domain
MAIHRSTVLPVPPSRLWQALTDETLLSRWFGADVTLDPRPGGQGIFRGPHGTRTARVREVEPERRLAFDWDDEPDAGVDLTITEVPDGSRLDVVETPPASVAAPEASLVPGDDPGTDLRWTDWDLRLLLLPDVVDRAPRALVAV